MFRTIQKFRTFSLERIWFSNHEISKCDVIRYLRAKNPISNNYYIINEEIETIINEISIDDEDLLKKMSKTVRYEINRSLKENIATSFWTGKDLLVNKNILNEFENVYIKLAETTNNKKLLKAYDRGKINNLIISNSILISKSEIDSIKVFHVYAWGNADSVLLYSASNFRIEKDSQYLAGRINKLLHFKDMIYFKRMGVKNYDWGNISSSTNPNGIDKFKMSFGGSIEKRYNIFVGNTLKGKFLVASKKNISKIL